jgi:hypothetical protein
MRERRAGVPAKMYFRISRENLYELILFQLRKNSATECGKTPQLNAEKLRNYYRDYNQRIQKRSRGPAGFAFSSNGETPKAVSLFAEVTIKNRWQVGQRGASRHGWKLSTIQKWIRAYYQLLEQLGGEKKHRRQITKLVEWYAEHHNDQYMPEARTFSSFVEKFTRIQSAMQRAEGIEDENDDPEIKEVLI